VAQVELRTLDAIRRQVILLTGNRLDAARATELINTTLENVWHDRQWSAAKVETTLTTRAPKSAGTVTLGLDHLRVNGLDTSFTSADVGSYLRVSSEVTFFRVVAVAGQQLVLETAYPGVAFANASYVLFRHIYALPSDFRLMLSPSYWDFIEQVPQQRLDQIDPLRLYMDQLPTLYTMRGFDSTYQQLIEVWPVPSVSVIIRYTYLKSLAPYSPLDGSVLVPLRPDLVAYMAAGEGLLVLAAEARDARQSQILAQQGERWLTLGRGILEEAYRADRHRFGVPDTVRTYHRTLGELGNYYTFAPFVPGGEGGGAVDLDSRMIAISWVELEVPTVVTEPRLIQISWVEFEVPASEPRLIQISWVELEAPEPAAPRLIQISWVEFETPEPPDRVMQISWVEFEVPEPQHRMIDISWVEFEVPDPPDRLIQIGWVEFEVPEPIAPREIWIGWVEFEVPEGEARDLQIGWVELETPDPPP
jgi:hypothetical protein